MNISPLKLKRLISNRIKSTPSEKETLEWVIELIDAVEEEEELKVAMSEMSKKSIINSLNKGNEK